MKSNEEFIAGIYEKAAVYKEEKETIPVRGNWLAKATRIAAMAAICIGLAGVGSLVVGNKTAVPNQVPNPGNENYGIALTSELGETEGEAAEGATQFRIGPMAESVTFTGIVEEICAEENRIWMKLLFDESAPEDAKDSMVCIRWDMLEPISEKITVGITITATGSLSEYQNEASEKNGCAELVLTDTANLEIK